MALKLITAPTPTEGDAGLLDKVEAWTSAMTSHSLVRKSSTEAIYFCHTPGAPTMMCQLAPEEAVVFERHVAFPARLADLVDLPRRVRVAKLLLLIAAD